VTGKKTKPRPTELRKHTQFERDEVSWPRIALRDPSSPTPSTPPMAIVDPNERLTAYVGDPADQPQPLVRVGSQVSRAQRRRARRSHMAMLDGLMMMAPWESRAKERDGLAPSTSFLPQREESGGNLDSRPSSCIHGHANLHVYDTGGHHTLQGGGKKISFTSSPPVHHLPPRRRL
jgi:hypothetical protein